MTFCRRGTAHRARALRRRLLQLRGRLPSVAVVPVMVPMVVPVGVLLMVRMMLVMLRGESFRTRTRLAVAVAAAIAARRA
jgi:hypothetical protein